jgi:type II secretory pathway pseudopilin PulG
MRRFTSSRPAFTLFQLLVVLALLGVLLGLLLPAVQKVREAAARTQCQNNMKQLGIAMHNVNDTYNKMPPLVGHFPGPPGKSYGTVYFYMLPFIEQDNLYKLASNEKGEFFVWHNAVYKYPIRTFVSPLDKSAGTDDLYQGWLATTSYAANFLVFGDPTTGSMQGSPRIPVTFPDGMSNTILFTTRYRLCNGDPCAWGYYGAYTWAPAYAWQTTAKFQVMPAPGDCDANRAQGMFPAGINAGLADGSVRVVSRDISPQTWWYATTPNGGEVLGADW